MDESAFRIELDEPAAARAGVASVAASLLRLPDAIACFVLAHGAGAGMDHAFLLDTARGLAERGIATLRFQFPFMERGSRRTDPPAIATCAVRSGVVAAIARCGDLPIVGGGKSFGGRMASHAAAEGLVPAVRGLVFLGFPLHPAEKPGVARAAHLPRVPCPMLFVQGTRDALADLGLIRAMTEPLGDRATLAVVDDADHAFHVRASSGRRDREAHREIHDAVAAWIRRLTSG